MSPTCQRTKNPMAIVTPVSVFNGPLEFGIRAALLLTAAYPVALDVNRLVALDYLVVHSGDVPGGPPSLHAPSPMRAGELSIRRNLVEQGLQLLCSRGLVNRFFRIDGITYQANDLGSLYVASMSGAYFDSLRERAAWVIPITEGMEWPLLNELLSRTSDVWKSEFVDLDEASTTNK